MLLFETEGATRAWGPTQGCEVDVEEEARESVARLLNENDGNDEAKVAHHATDDTKTSAPIPPQMVAKRTGRWRMPCLGL